MYIGILNISNFPIFYLLRNFPPTKTAINIGKSEDTCQVSLEDLSIDDIHCNVSYIKDIGWIIKNNCSVDYSGTWLFISNDTSLGPSFVFKTNECLFEGCYVVSNK